jgi:hypothetical protein
MNATKAEVLHRLDQLSETQLQEVLAFLQVLAQEPEDLTSEEWAEVRAGQEEVARGEWIRWDHGRRPAV